MSIGSTQLVGTAPCDTIGLVIANMDDELRRQMNIDEKYSAIGLIGSRTGAGAQIKAVDDAVKTTSAEVISIELPRDTKGWGGHGNFIILGSSTFTDVKRAVEISLENIRVTTGEVYISDAGHMECHYSARCDAAVNKAFGIPIGMPFGFVCVSPAPIGLAAADEAAKTGDIDIVKTMRPTDGTSHSNEVIIVFTGKASAVYSAVMNGKKVGLTLLENMGSKAKPVGNPYLIIDKG